ncbi:hypothetical protein [Streptomyces sp. NPDC007205]|uniref:hypothetical protein n=1 Tax=Streptomyces sp. NPDC007205 TaxID=3154316 RepID=UPI0033E02D69
MVNNGATVPKVTFCLENWTPFLNSSNAFDAVAFSLHSDGTPAEWYRAGYNIPRYPWTPTASTSGYAVVYTERAPYTTPNVAVVYSKSNGQRFGTSARLKNVRNTMDWDTGIGVLPGISVVNSQSGSILDYTIRLVPRARLSAGLAADLTRQVGQIRAPALYGPGFALSGELATIASRLRGYLHSTAGTRTNHLAQLL